MDVQSVLKKYDINPEASVHRAIQNVGFRIEESTDPLAVSNQIIKQLGGWFIKDERDAPIIAKCLVEQAMIFNMQKQEYDPVDAMRIAELKLADMKAKHPYMFVMKEKTMEAATATNRGGDKKAKALEIFESNRGKKASDVAKLIQVELGITFANAYYYVSRVFK
jgi:hypothetical protein